MTILLATLSHFTVAIIQQSNRDCCCDNYYYQIFCQHCIPQRFDYFCRWSSSFIRYFQHVPHELVFPYFHKCYVFNQEKQYNPDYVFICIIYFSAFLCVLMFPVRKQFFPKCFFSHHLYHHHFEEGNTCLSAYLIWSAS